MIPLTQNEEEREVLNIIEKLHKSSLHASVRILYIQNWYADDAERFRALLLKRVLTFNIVMPLLIKKICELGVRMLEEHQSGKSVHRTSSPTALAFALKHNELDPKKIDFGGESDVEETFVEQNYDLQIIHEVFELIKYPNDDS